MLSESGVESPRLDARLLLQHVMGISHEKLLLIKDKMLDAKLAEQFQKIIDRRTRREPISHIIGTREFWGLDFQVSRDVLDPRVDTETLIEVVKEFYKNKNADLRILDLGTGSGCILLSLLHEYPNASGVAVDASPLALNTAKRNAEKLGLSKRAEWQNGSWFEHVSGQFDVIVSNPPYIPTHDIKTLQQEVRDYEPHLALDGGADGLDCYRAILSNAGKYLKPNSYLCLELGQGQAAAVVEIALVGGLTHIKTKRDLAGIERVVTFTY